MKKKKENRPKKSMHIMLLFKKRCEKEPLQAE